MDLVSLRLAEVHWALQQNGWAPVPEPMPRARLVSQVVASQNVTQAVHQINIATTAVVEKPVKVVPGPVGKAEITVDRPGRIEIKATAPTRQLLVLSESFHSGWKARINGQEIPVLRAYGDYLGCGVDSGEKTVVFRFEPRSFYLGAKITVAGLAVALLWFGIAFLVTPKAPAPAATPTPSAPEKPAKKRGPHQDGIAN